MQKPLRRSSLCTVTVLSHRCNVPTNGGAVENPVDIPGKAPGYAGDTPSNRLFRLRFRSGIRVEHIRLAI